MHTATLHANAGSHGVDALVVALNGNLGTFARHTGNALDSDQTVGNLGNLGLEQALKEHRTGTAEDNLRVVVLVVNTMDDGTYRLALVILVVRNLLALGQDELVVLVVNQQHLALPHLIDLARDNLSHAVLVLVVERVVNQFQHFRSQCLTQVQDSTASELGKVHALRHFLAHLVVVLNLLGVRQRNLLVLVLHFTVGHDHTVAINLKIALVRVHNDVEVLVRTENLGDNVAEALLQNAHQRGAVDVLVLCKILEGVEHANALFFLNCHFLYFLLLLFLSEVPLGG